MKQKVAAILGKQKKEQIVVYLLLAALLVVVLWPADTKNRAKDQTGKAPEGSTDTADRPTGSTPAEQMETALAKALAQVQGVGKVQVAITLESTSRKVVEKDIPDNKSSQESKNGEDTSSSSSESREEATVYEKGSDGAEIPYVISEEYPAVRGVLVIAEGGDNPVVVEEIQEAVMALFQVDATKIKVMKMK